VVSASFDSDGVEAGVVWAGLVSAISGSASLAAGCSGSAGLVAAGLGAVGFGSAGFAFFVGGSTDVASAGFAWAGGSTEVASAGACRGFVGGSTEVASAGFAFGGKTVVASAGGFGACCSGSGLRISAVASARDRSCSGAACLRRAAATSAAVKEPASPRRVRARPVPC
jgi:hypothetical protein